MVTPINFPSTSYENEGATPEAHLRFGSNFAFFFCSGWREIRLFQAPEVGQSRLFRKHRIGAVGAIRPTQGAFQTCSQYNHFEVATPRSFAFDM